MRYALGIEYDGSGFLGWQRHSGGPTVQAAVEAALSFVADAAIEVTCAGRTDAGVHAACQVVHFDSDAPRFDEPAKDKDGIAAPASLKPKVVPYDESPATVKSSRIEPPPTVAAPAIPAAPVAAVASAASSMPEVEELDVDAEWDKAMNEARGDSEGLDIDFEPPPDDLHRAEAEVMAEDEASATRIELAKAYLDIGDLEGARSMLEEVFNDGGPAAKAEAQRILKEIG
jgi:FimV-like protein